MYDSARITVAALTIAEAAILASRAGIPLEVFIRELWQFRKARQADDEMMRASWSL